MGSGTSIECWIRAMSPACPSWRWWRFVRAEQRRRRNGGGASVVADLARILSAQALGPAIGSGRFQLLEPSRAQAHRRNIEALVSDVDLSDVGSLSREQLNTALQAYSEQEKSVSQRRREVQRVMDTFNAEIGARYASGAASVDDLLAEQRVSNQHRVSHQRGVSDQHSSSPVPDPSGSTDHQSGRTK